MEEPELQEPPVPSTKDWLQQTNQSLSKLKSIKKTSYQLGGGPREREVNCPCNYRSKSKTSFLSLEADPPQLSQFSQETASNSNMSVPELLKHYHEHRSPGHRKPKRRPYSATICSTRDAPRQKHEEKKERDYNHNPFIAVKGSTVSPKPRPSSGISTGSADGHPNTFKDPDHVDEVQRATAEGMRKYSAFGQDVESSSPVPPPPRASPEPPMQSPQQGSEVDEFRDESVISNEDESYSEDEESLDSFDSPQQPDMKPLVFEIPTADVEYGSDEEESHKALYSAPRASEQFASEDRALSTVDYVAKSEAFLDELENKQTQEAEELSEMFKDMQSAKDRVRDIDLRSLVSSPMTPGRRTTTPSGAANVSSQDPSGLRVVTVGLGSEVDLPPEGSNYEALWVEEPYQPRVSNYYVQPERIHRPLRRVQSAKTSRSAGENEFVLQGKTFELLDSHDLAVRERLSANPSRRSSDSGHPCQTPLESSPVATRAVKSRTSDLTKSPTAKEKVVGKPPRPSSSKKRHSKEKTNKHASEDMTSSPHPSPARKSSLRKSFSQGDVRCLSPEVISTVKKTVSFSEEVLEQHTRPLKGPQRKAADGPDTSTDSETLGNKEPGLERAELVDSVEHKSEEGEEDVSQDKAPIPGVIIQNGLEVNEPNVALQQSPSDLGPAGPTKSKKESARSSLIAKVKEATRCSCHVEGCHCRDITRPTRRVLCQAKAVREKAEHAEKAAGSPKEKLLKHRPTRPSSAPIRRASVERPHSPPSPSRSRVTTGQHRQSGSEVRRRSRPVSAHIKRPNVKDSTRNRAAARTLKERFRPSPPFPPGLRDKKESTLKAMGSVADMGFVWGAGEEDVAASDECMDVYYKLKEKGVNVSMETIKRGLMAPPRRASENCMTSLASSPSSGLLSRPETWLPVEYARVKIWDNVLKKGK